MSKKSLESVTADLSALAAALPTQRPAAAVQPAQAPHVELKVVPKSAARKPKPAAEEKLTQFSFSMRQSLRKELARLAADEDMTMRAFILNALKEKGLSVREDDLLDLRKER